MQTVKTPDDRISPEQPLELQPERRQAVHRLEQALHRDKRQCTCAMPMVLTKFNEALGTMVTLRLCCMARALQQLTGIELAEVFDFPPGWVWDCNELHDAISPEGIAHKRPRGEPPAWLRKRLEEKGIAIKNDPAANRD